MLIFSIWNYRGSKKYVDSDGSMIMQLLLDCSWFKETLFLNKKKFGEILNNTFGISNSNHSIFDGMV